MSKDGELIFAGIIFLVMAAYAFYLSRSDKSLLKMVDNVKKTPFYVSQRVDYSAQYFRFAYTFGAVFFVFCGLLALFTRTAFSQTVLGGYIFKTIVLTIFGGGLAAIIYSSRRFRK